MKNKPAGTPWHARITYTIPSTGVEVDQEINDSSHVFSFIHYGILTEPFALLVLPILICVR